MLGSLPKIASIDEVQVFGSIINYKLCHIFLFFLLLCYKWEFYRVYDTDLQMRKMTGSEEEVQKKSSIGKISLNFGHFISGKHGLGVYL